MRFTSTLRQVKKGSIIITIPHEIIKKLRLKKGAIEEFEIFKEAK